MLVWVHDIILGDRIKPLYLDTVCENGRPLGDILQVFSGLARDFAEIVSASCQAH
jgi:hypothetical protein